MTNDRITQTPVNDSETSDSADTELTRDRSWDVHNRKIQLLALQQRYREADDYNRPAVKLLLRNVMDGFNGER
jgi:hypothetical protein